MNNAELIKALRRCSYTTVAGYDREDGYCKPCAYYAEDSADVTCIDRMMIDAADALEAADRLLDQNTKRCEGLRQQLREAHESYEKHINELEARLPKEGEWIWDSDTGTYLCSECNATSPQEDQDGEYIDCPRYCPSCGSRMRKGEQE